jgi:transposase
LTLAGAFERTFFAPPAGRKPQFVVLRGHRQHCARCGKTLREPIHFAAGKRRCLRSFARLVVELCSLMTLKHVAAHLGIAWDMAKDLYKEHLRKVARPRLSRLRYLAVDEFATHKGHRYMTIVLDLETGAIVHAQEGKGSEALLPFLKLLKRLRAPLQAIAMDMSPAYLLAVREVFGDTLDVVHDPYHVVAMASRALDETRRDLYRHLDPEARRYIKGSRFILLRGLENLKPSGLQRLAELMEINEPLYQAYLLKEDLRQFWSLPDRDSAEVFLDDWVDQARALNLKHFRKLANSLDRARPGLLAYFVHRISSGPIEGTNNKVKVLKRQAYGFRDMEYFKLRLLTLHTLTYAFPG